MVPAAQIASTYIEIQAHDVMMTPSHPTNHDRGTPPPPYPPTPHPYPNSDPASTQSDAIMTSRVEFLYK